MPFDHFEHRKRLTMRALDSLAALHTCHIFLQRGKPKHHLALEAQWCGVGPLAPYLKKKVQILSILVNRPPISPNKCIMYMHRFWINSCTTHQVDVDRPNIPAVAPIQIERMENPDNHIKLELTISPRETGYPAWIPFFKKNKKKLR